MSLYTLLPKITTVFCEKDIPEPDLGKICHLDLETSSLSPEEGDILVVNIGFNPGEDGFFKDAIVCKVSSERCPSNLKRLLENESIKIIHNACFDSLWIKKKWDINIHNIRCTKILAKFNRKSNNSYAKLVKTVTGLELPKGSISCSPWGLPFNEWSSDMKTYCSYDVAFGLQILNYLNSLCTEEIKDRYLKIMSSWTKLQDVLLNVEPKDLRHL
tara:strand:- start:289 stop:933 length:645 start_codon:yes stop_codon:yes gene_type:complete